MVWKYGIVLAAAYYLVDSFAASKFQNWAFRFGLAMKQFVGSTTLKVNYRDTRIHWRPPVAFRFINSQTLLFTAQRSAKIRPWPFLKFRGTATRRQHGWEFAARLGYGNIVGAAISSFLPSTIMTTLGSATGLMSDGNIMLGLSISLFVVVFIGQYGHALRQFNRAVQALNATPEEG